VLKIALGVALLLIIALIGYRRTFIRLKLPRGAQLIFLTGTEFILVGVALGDQLIGLLDEQTIRSLTPLFGLGLGVIGLIFGIQLELDKILRFPSRYILMTFTQAICTMLVVFWPFYFVLEGIFGGDRQSILLASLVLAATAACTAQTALALIHREFGLRGARVMELLRYMSSVDAVVGLLALQIALCLMQVQPVLGIHLGSGFQWFALSMVVGGATGFLLHLLTRVRCSDEELLIFVLGMAVFSGGIALSLKLSPLFVNTLMGLVVANLPGSRNRIFHLLERLEKPFYIVFLILAGAIWHPAPPWGLPLAILYLGLRVIGKVSGGFLAARIAPESSRPPLTVGLGLISQGGIAIAMVMNYYQLSSAAVTDAVVTTVLLAVILNELASPYLARAVLRRAGEIERWPA
jgi:Kef-type K+ transport system membrane component KefB